MKCSNCGSENPEGSIFCATCGAEFTGNVLTMKESGKENGEVPTAGQANVQESMFGQGRTNMQEPAYGQGQPNVQESMFGQGRTNMQEPVYGQEQANVQEPAYGQGQAYEQPVIPQKKSKRVSMPVKIISAVVAVVIVCSVALVAFGKNIEILAIGSKKYYEAIETRQFTSLNSLGNSVAANSTGNKAYSMSFGAKLLGKSASDYSGENAFMKTLADGIYMVFPKKDSDINSGFGSYEQSSDSYKAEQDVINNTTLNLNICKDQAKKSIFAKGNVNYKNKSILSAIASMDSKSAKFKIPELSDKSFSQSITGYKSDDSAKAVQTEMNSIMQKVYGEINNSDVAIQNGQTVTIDGNVISCDKITVNISESKLRQMCIDFLTGVKNSKTIKDYIKTKYAQSNSFYNNDLDGQLDEMISMIRTVNIGDFKMVVCVKGDYFNSQIISRTITCGNGSINYSNTLYNCNGNANLTVSSYGSSCTIKFPYTYKNKVLKGTFSVENGLAFSSSAATADLTVDFNSTNSLGYYPCKLCVNTSGSGNGICFAISNSGKQSLFTLSSLVNNKELAEIKLGVTPSKDTFTVPSMSSGTLDSDVISGMMAKWQKICNDNGIGK